MQHLELCGTTKGRNSNVFFETPSVTNRKKIIPKFFCISGTKKQTKKQPKQIECRSVLFGSNRKWLFEASLIMRKHTVKEWDCIVGLWKILALNSCVLQLFGNFRCLIWNKLFYRKIVFLLKVNDNLLQCAPLTLTLPSSGGNLHYSSG